MSGTRILGTLMITLALAGLVGGAIPTLAQGGGAVTVIGGDPANLRELVAYQARVFGPQIGSTTVLVGALPANLPFELPLPEHARVIGSVSIEGQRLPTQVSVILSVGLSPEAVVAFYGEALAGDEWTSLAGQRGPGGGFVDRAFSNLAFCHGDETLVNISANALPDGTTDVRLYLQLDGSPALCDATPPMEALDAAFALLPQLRAPEGTTVRRNLGGGGGGGPGMRRSASNEAVLASEMPVGDLIERYNDQLLAAGWRHVTTEAADGFAWSGWTITDDDGVLWSSVLTLAANPAVEGEYYARLQVEEVVEP